MSGRLEDCRTGRKEEKGQLCAFRQCAHRRVAAGWEAKRKMLAIDGADARRLAILARSGRGKQEGIKGIRDDVEVIEWWLLMVKAIFGYVSLLCAAL